MKPRSLMRRRGAEAAAVLARAYLKQAGRALRRMHGGDPEGLHDTRVALRRLDALLRGRRAQLPRAARMRPELRALARASNQARDLEVRLAWGEARLEAGAEGQREVTLVWCRALELELDEAHAQAARTFVDALPGLAARMKRALPRKASAVGPRYGDLLAVDLKREGTRLRRRLAALETGGDEALHRLRIDAKRLRYLLSPWHGGKGAVAALEAALGRWQEMLGDWRDLGLIGESLRERDELEPLARRCSEQRAAMQEEIQHFFAGGAQAQLKRLLREARLELKKDKR